MRNSPRVHWCCTALLLASLALCAAQEQGTLGYLPPGTPEVGGIEHMVLIYHGMSGRVPWTREAIMPYVAYVDEQGVPQDWFFDSFLFTEFATDKGTYLHLHREGTPLPTADDWVWLADGWFRPTTGLVGLEQAVGEVAGRLGPPEHRSRVVIAMPVPLSDDTAFGPLPGQQDKLDFRVTEDRLQALQWYVQRVLDQWRERDNRHLELVGFYWSGEYTPPADHETIRCTADYLHAMGYKLFQIPFSTDFSIWRDLRLDAIMPHPVYYTRTADAHLVHLLWAARKARIYSMGVQLEVDGRVLTEERFRERFVAAMDAGAHYGWMQGALMGYYEGGGAVKQLAATPGVGRDLYRMLYEYVKGTYVPSGEHDFSGLPLISSGNLALASGGAKIQGCVRDEDRPELAPEKIIDGDLGCTGSSGFGYFSWPGGFIIELPEAATAARTQTLLHDLADQEFQYRIETSLDGQVWELAVDKSEGRWCSWQVDVFAPRQARYIRFVGLHNSLNSNFQVVEFEVYSDAE